MTVHTLASLTAQWAAYPPCSQLTAGNYRQSCGIRPVCMSGAAQQLVPELHLQLLELKGSVSITTALRARGTGPARDLAALDPGFKALPHELEQRDAAEGPVPAPGPPRVGPGADSRPAA
ncbi:hypothetical protein MHYP_G00166530 [Metynnis hypsauchen]